MAAAAAALAKAAELYAKKDWAAAIDAYRGCIALDLLQTPDQKGSAYFALGYSYYELNDLKSSIECYTKVIALGSSADLYPSLNNRGKIYYERNEFGLALADWNRAIRERGNGEKQTVSLLNRADLFHAMNLPGLEISDLHTLAALTSDEKERAAINQRIETIQKTRYPRGGTIVTAEWMFATAISDADSLSEKMTEMKALHSVEMKACRDAQLACSAELTLTRTELKACSAELKAVRDAFAAVQKRMRELEKMVEAVTTDKLHPSGKGGGSSGGGGGGSSLSGSGSVSASPELIDLHPP